MKRWLKKIAVFWGGYRRISLNFIFFFSLSSGGWGKIKL